jgi:hypothetical protein
MKWLNGYRIRLVLVGFVAALVLGGGGEVYGDFTFGTPTNLGPAVNSSGDQEGPSISADGCTLYFQSNRPGGFGSWDIWVATRPTTDAEWGPPENLGPAVNTPSFEGSPCISPDNLSLYFSSNHPGGFGGFDLWVTTRATKADMWGIPVNLSGINGPSDDFDASISSDGLELYFVSNRAGGSGDYDLWVTNRATLSDLWGPPVNLGSIVNSSSRDNWPSISPDGLVLFFDSMRPGGYGLEDVYMTRRATRNDPWGEPVNLGPPVNTSADHGTSNISADGRTLYFTSNQGGSYDLWQASIIPIVDFNGDGKVDIQDLLILIEHWGTSDTLCDIGPMPWGDGKVDEKDLEVLMRYWQQEVLPVSLIAYWKLDEAEGIVAADKAGTNNGTLVGNPIWQPAGGKLGGALQLDGMDDCVTTEIIRDPSEGAFSVFAWIKGGAPGQVIVSQVNGANWLMAGAPDGILTTEVKEPGRKGKPLVSQAVITDGAWHRVGLTWDGSNRILYVDDVGVVKDTQANLTSSPSGLYMGAGSTLAPGSFWKGLIDDVRIYNRAVKP